MSRVEVLCPNGFRVSVDVSSNTKIIKILEEACLKQGFLPINDYELKHGRRSLEMSATFAKSGLINNSKVELVRLEEGWQEALVQVNIQLSDGTRLKSEFPPRTSLFDVLKLFEGELGGEVVLSQHESLHPVLIFVNEQIVGECELQHTTLMQLGLVKGRTLLRHVLREVDEKRIRGIEEGVMKEKERMERLKERAEEKKKENREREMIEERRGVLDGEGGGGMDVDQVQVVVEEKGKQQPSLQQQQPSIQQLQHPQQQQQASIQQLQQPSIQHPQQQQQQPAIQQQQNQQPSIEQQSSIQHQQQHLIQPKTLPSHSSIQPDPGQQHRQNDTNTQTHTQTHTQEELPQIINPFADFKFPESTKGKQLYRNDLSEFRREEFLPCDRETVTYRMDEDMQVDAQDGAEEVPESFYDVTEADAALLQKRLHGKVKEMSEEGLRTEEMRGQRRDDMASRYARVVLRFQSPGAHVVQALFMARETVNAVYSFVRELVGGADDDLHFELYTSPPKNVLSDMTQTLVEADLVPMTRVYISTATGAELKTETLHKTTVLQADQIVLKWLQLRKEPNKTTNKEETNNKEETKNKEDTKNKEETKRTNKGQGSKGQKNKQTPKWLKKGKN